MFALVLAMGLAQSPASVTYSNAGARAEVVLSELSKLYGEPLSASASVRALPLTIRVKNADGQVLLEKIAEVTEGKWVTVRGVRTLTLDDAKRQRRLAIENQVSQKRRVSNFENFIKQTAKAKDPLRSALVQVIQAIGLETLTTFDIKYQLVFSNRPAPLEHALPELDPGVSDALLMIPAQFDVDVVKIPPTAPPIIAPPTKAPAGSRVVISFTSPTDSEEECDMVSILLVSPTGVVLGESVYNLDAKENIEEHPAQTEAPASAMADAFGAGHEPQLPGEKLSPSAELLEIRKVYRQSVAPSSGLTSKLSDPIKTDFSSYTGDLIRQWAELKNVEFVGQLDPYMLLEFATDKSTPTTGWVDLALGERHVRHDGSWVLVTPLHFPYPAAASLPPEPDVVSFSEALKTAKDSTEPSLEELLSGFRGGFTSLSYQVPVRILKPNLDLSLLRNEEFLTWYDTLDPTDLAALATERAVPLSRLSMAARDFLMRGLFGVGGPSIVVANVQNAESTSDTSEDIGKPASQPTMDDNPYEVADQPIPSESYVKLVRSQSPAFRFQNPKTPLRKTVSTSPDGLARLALRGTEPQVEIGTAYNLKFNFHFCGTINGLVAGVFFKFPNDGVTVRPSQFPGELGKLYQTALAQAREVETRMRERSAGAGGPGEP